MIYMCIAEVLRKHPVLGSSVMRRSCFAPSSVRSSVVHVESKHSRSVMYVQEVSNPQNAAVQSGVQVGRLIIARTRMTVREIRASFDRGIHWVGNDAVRATFVAGCRIWRCAGASCGSGLVVSCDEVLDRK